MLTVSHAQHFPNLAFRLDRTYALASGTPPTTVIVFDDEDAIAEFCLKHSHNCTQSWHVSVTKLALQQELGPTGYAEARRLVAGRSVVTQGRANCRGQPLPRSCVGCRLSSPGRSYQTIKKFYGAISPRAPAHCLIYWVSDAESYPFRPYDFHSLMRWTVKVPEVPFQLFSSWFPNQHACERICDAREQGAYASCADARCALPISDSLGLQMQIEEPLEDPTSRNGSHKYSKYHAMAVRATHNLPASSRRFTLAQFCDPGHAARSNITPEAMARLHPTQCRLTRSQQTDFDVGNNWWTYPVAAVREMKVAVESRHKADLWRVLAGSRFNDAAVWVIWAVGNAVRAAAAHSPPTAMRHGHETNETHSRRLNVRNIIPMIEQRFPGPFASCCRSCAQGKPCSEVTDLWSGCMKRAYRRHGVTLANVSRFVVEELGIWGLWWNAFGPLFNKTEHSGGRLGQILAGDSRISWIINGAPLEQPAFVE